MIAREGLVTYRGKPIVLIGESAVQVGEKAPDFRVSKSIEEDVALSQLEGQFVVVNCIPSIDTPVCSKQTARFHDELVNRSDVTLLTVSMDLPFAIQRWCALREVNKIVATSDYKHQELSRRFGLLMRGLGLIARSVFVIDPTGVVKHGEIVARMEDEPNYEAALAAL